MGEIQWFENKTKSPSKADVSITIQKYQKDKQCTCITFRNDCHLKITHDDLVQVGIDPGENRVYFKDGVTSGFKLGKQGKNNKQIRIPALLTDYVGNYDLRMAASGDCFYVKKED